MGRSGISYFIHCLLPIILLSAAAGVVSASCPNFYAVSSFTSQAFAGKWFEAAVSARLKIETEDVMSKCNFVTFKASSKKVKQGLLFDAVSSSNASLQYVPWSYGRTDVFTAISDFSRTACSAVGTLSTALNGNSSAEVGRIKQLLATIPPALAAISQGAVKNESANKVADDIKNTATSIKALADQVLKNNKGNKRAKGPLDTIKAAADNITAAAKLLKLVQVILPGFRAGLDVTGTASADFSTGVARLRLKFPNKGYDHEFKVVSIDGVGKSKYKALLLYSCSEVGGVPRHDVLVLTRSRDVENLSFGPDFQLSVDQISQLLECDNPLVHVFQDSGPDCKLP